MAEFRTQRAAGMSVGRSRVLRGSSPNQRASSRPWISSRKGPATASYTSEKV